MSSHRVLLACSLLVLALVAMPTTGQRSRQRLPEAWNVRDYPDPHSLTQEQQRLCGRYNVSAVCDPNGLISRTDADAIDNLINSVYRETVCSCVECQTDRHGFIIRVAIMPRMERVFPEGDNSTMGMLRDAQMYSYILTRRWRMEGACNETLLILYAKYDGILYTLTRENAMRKLSNDDVERISLMVRHFFDSDSTIADGILEMIRRYKLVFEDKYQEAFQPIVGRGNRG